MLLGYACLNTVLRVQKPPVFTSRTCRLKTAQEKGLDYIYTLVHQNLQDLETIFYWNHQNNIHLFRMSSEMFPFATHQEFCNDFNFEQFVPMLQHLGTVAKELNQRVSFHPGQFTQISSEREPVRINSIREIEFHCKILDTMGCSPDSVIIVHGGGKAGGKQAALSRFAGSYKLLSDSARKRLVLENCELCYSLQDLLQISKELSCPIVFDIHHHNLNPGTLNNDTLLDTLVNHVYPIWNAKGMKIKFHLSESKPEVTIDDSITKQRAHSDYITEIPKLFYDLERCFPIAIMVEAKMKEQAVLQVRKEK